MSHTTRPFAPDDEHDEVISLVPELDAAGEVVWATPSPAPTLHRSGETDLRRAPGCSLVRVDDATDPEPLSRLPRVRMAGTDPWADILQVMGDNENAPTTRGRDVVMAPGGQMHVTNGGAEAQPLSVLPKVRMAGFGLNPDPDPHEVRDIMRLDPERLEGWEPVSTRVLSGWRFRLTPEPGAPQFQFFAFRSPSDRNLFRVYVISPNADNQYGHHSHMIRVVVGGKDVPVLCGPSGDPARDLATARAHAGKWMLYTYQRSMLGTRPGFSE